MAPNKLMIAAGATAVALATGLNAQTATAPAKAPAVEKKAADVKVKLSDLPPAVKARVDAETKGATLKGLSKEQEKGKTVYELESLVNGRTRDLMIDSIGKVYVVEEQLDVDKAPAAVKSALEAKGTIVALQSVTENAKIHYEGLVRTKAGKRVALELDADGKPVGK
jgi:uncharacterized membrane protein YkoI